jgi:hypothetical protein
MHTIKCFSDVLLVIDFVGDHEPGKSQHEFFWRPKPAVNKLFDDSSVMMSEINCEF